jgi:hypothetical protein
MGPENLVAALHMRHVRGGFKAPHREKLKGHRGKPEGNVLVRA